jgi:hypothetical protein
MARALIALICSFGLFAQAAVAKPYAPLLDVSKVKDTYLKMKVRGAKVPPAEEVPVAAYSPASIFSVTQVASSGDGEFQENRIVSMAIKESPETVQSFYKSKLSGWTEKSFKGRYVFVKTGKQFFWGGNARLAGPRVEILNLAQSTTGSPEIMKLKQNFPEYKTVLKVFYEKSSVGQVKVDVDSLVSRCIASQIESKKKLMGGKSNSAGEEYLQKMAEASCRRVRVYCEKDTADRNCQKYAQKYS